MAKKTDIDYRKAALKALEAQLKSPDTTVVFEAAKAILGYTKQQLVTS